MTRYSKIGWAACFVTAIAACASAANDDASGGARVTGSARTRGLVVGPLAGGDAGPFTPDVAQGAFSCDIDVAVSQNPTTVGPVLERDRMFMSARPGFVRKDVPFVINPQTLRMTTGGRYLFATRADADAYFAWITTEYDIDGSLFLKRAYWVNPSCHAFTVIGSDDFEEPVANHDVVRTERFTAKAGDQTSDLVARWPAIRDAAKARGLTSARLLYNATESLVELTYFDDRTTTLLPEGVTALTLLTIASPLGDKLASAGYTRTFDRTELVLSTWSPFAAGDKGQPAPFPNSPPLPGPSCGDGVCEPSRTEAHGSCASDCAAHCGDGTCQPAEGETVDACPSDCREF